MRRNLGGLHLRRCVVTVYYKATRPDGTDFRTGQINYEVGSVVRHPNPHGDHPSGYLSVATVPTECMRMCWPCRLFAVEPVDIEVSALLDNEAAAAQRERVVQVVDAQFGEATPA